MIAHVVLFTPRADLPRADLEAFALAFERALTKIPFVRAARVGERQNFGRIYDARNPIDFSHAAIIEFESEQDLLSYLDHPAHQELGRQFYAVSTAALACDFELVDGSDAARLLAGR